VLERQLLEWAESEQATDTSLNATVVLDDQIPDGMRTLIRSNLLDDANQVVLTLLRARIASGDTDLAAVELLLQHYRLLIARHPPLSHIETMPLHPNGHLYECFDRFIDLIGQQSRQIGEMSLIISELI
jgi:hypothetical protein